MQRLSPLCRALGPSAARLTTSRLQCQLSRGLSNVKVIPAAKRAFPAAAKDNNSSVHSDQAAEESSDLSSIPSSSPAAMAFQGDARSRNGNSGSENHDLSGSLFNPDEGYLQGSHWSTSFQGMATQPFDPRISEMLMAPVPESEIEIKPDGLLYLPEIKYRRILNRAFGPGGWGLVPRGAHSVSGRTLSREYALVCLGRFISQARGEQDFFDESGLATATEGCKSNALVRCCKDLGVASELWDPAFITQFKAKRCVEEWVTHAVKGSKKRMWRLKERQWDYPWAKK
ncbi:hypothetical protein GGI21_002481 [Coemansia aciculifera]|uniref:Uncharacterized protein n=1 Tax=Coemansia aciculifera TaxID=417176 RepID=A0ACC1M9T9_9FUNG|nr:hypothetical protein IWW38_000287 [Coemansia aciculifera]KAJ2908840.1 hypothetical protein GGI21_002481 [Coemansia aciculifera]